MIRLLPEEREEVARYIYSVCAHHAGPDEGLL